MSAMVLRHRPFDELPVVWVGCRRMRGLQGSTLSRVARLNEPFESFDRGFDAYPGITRLNPLCALFVGEIR